MSPLGIMLVLVVLTETSPEHSVDVPFFYITPGIKQLRNSRLEYDSK